MVDRYLEYHPIANRFRSERADGDALEALKADIAKRGLRRPVALFEGKVWDGRARMAACLELGVETKFRILKRKDDPVIYLLHRHSRYGEPSTTERRAALAIFREIDGPEWIAAFKARRREWIAEGRRAFRYVVGRPQDCAVCGKHKEFVHAHHALPLNVQFELGLEEPDHTHDWLCPTHHRYVHMLISVFMTDTRDGAFLDGIPDDYSTEWYQVEQVYQRAGALFTKYGGLQQNGLGRDYAEYET